MTRKRTPHGMLADTGATLTYESPATDELRPVAPDSAAPVERRTNGTVTPAGASELARMRWEAAKTPDFAERELDRVPAPDFAPFDKARKDYLGQRRRELHERTGGVSCAVGATLRGEAWLTAFGEYYATVAASEMDHESAERALKFLSKASIERAKAWDIAQVESDSRPRDPRAAHDFVAQARALKGGT